MRHQVVLVVVAVIKNTNAVLSSKFCLYVYMYVYICVYVCGCLCVCIVVIVVFCNAAPVSAFAWHLNVTDHCKNA